MSQVLQRGIGDICKNLDEQIYEKAIHRNNNHHNQILNAASFSTKRGPIEQTMKYPCNTLVRKMEWEKSLYILKGYSAFKVKWKDRGNCL